MIKYKIKNLEEYLKENDSIENKEDNKESKTVVFTFIRGNPPTKAHRYLCDKLSEKANELKTVGYLFLSQTKDTNKNPLSWEKKIFYFSKFVKDNIIINTNSNIKNIIQCVQYLNTLYNKIYLIIGSDRKLEFEKLLNTYNNNLFSFEEIHVESIGERDPDADSADLKSISASRLRKDAIEGNFEDFKQTCAFYDNQQLAKQLYNDVRSELVTIEKTKHISFNTVLNENFKNYFFDFLMLLKEKNILSFDRERIKNKDFYVIKYNLNLIEDFKNYIEYSFKLKRFRGLLYNKNIVCFFLKEDSEKSGESDLTNDLDDLQNKNSTYDNVLGINFNKYLPAVNFNEIQDELLKLFKYLSEVHHVIFKKSNTVYNYPEELIDNLSKNFKLYKKNNIVIFPTIQLICPENKDRTDVAKEISKELKINLNFKNKRPVLTLYNSSLTFELKNSINKNNILSIGTSGGSIKTEFKENYILFSLYKEIEKIPEKDLEKINFYNEIFPIFENNAYYKKIAEETVRVVKDYLSNERGYIYCKSNTTLPENKESLFPLIKDIYSSIIELAKKNNESSILTYKGNFNIFYPADILLYKEKELSNIKEKFNSIKNDFKSSNDQFFELKKYLSKMLEEKSIIGISLKNGENLKIYKIDSISQTEFTNSIQNVIQNYKEDVKCLAIVRSNPYTKNSLNETIYDISIYTDITNKKGNFLLVSLRTKGDINRFRIETKFSSEMSRIGEAPISYVFNFLKKTFSNEENIFNLASINSFFELRDFLSKKILSIIEKDEDISILSIRDFPLYNIIYKYIYYLNSIMVYVLDHIKNYKTVLSNEYLIVKNINMESLDVIKDLLNELKNIYKLKKDTTKSSEFNIKLNIFISLYIQLLYVAFIGKLIQEDKFSTFILPILKLSIKFEGLPYLMIK